MLIYTLMGGRFGVVVGVGWVGARVGCKDPKTSRAPKTP